MSLQMQETELLGAIINKYKEINGLGYYNYTKLYNSFVCPILDYCAEVWGFKDFKQIDYVQNKVLEFYVCTDLLH